MTDEQNLAPIDRDILRLIDALRAQHRACSPGMLALATQKSKAWIVTRVDGLRQRGLVEWSAGIGGSLRRTGTMEVNDPRYVPSVPVSAAEPPVPALSVATARGEAVNAGGRVVIKDQTGDGIGSVGYAEDAPVVEIGGQTFHVDLGKIAAALGQTPAVPPAKAAKRQARAKAAAKAKRPKRERTPAQIAATERMRQARADSIRNVAESVNA